MSITLDNNIEFRKSDGFINATQMCQAGGKQFKDWFRLESTKKLIKELEKSLNMQNCAKGLIDKKVGGNHSGSWIHPDLATSLAQWISPAFAIKVSYWIREWRSYSIENEEKFKKALSELKPSENILLEKEIQTKLAKVLNGEKEVETPAGFIDLMTKTQIIEIKEIKKWKHAIGQILSYGTFINKKKCIYLFGEESSENKEIINKVCLSLDIEVIYYN